MNKKEKKGRSRKLNQLKFKKERGNAKNERKTEADHMLIV